MKNFCRKDWKTIKTKKRQAWDKPGKKHRNIRTRQMLILPKLHQGKCLLINTEPKMTLLNRIIWVPTKLKICNMKIQNSTFPFITMAIKTLQKSIIIITQRNIGPNWIKAWNNWKIPIIIFLHKYKIKAKINNELKCRINSAKPSLDLEEILLMNNKRRYSNSVSACKKSKKEEYFLYNLDAKVWTE